MIEAASVHSTPRTAAPPADDLIGMAWWNALTEQERQHRMRIAGDTGRAVDAWRAFKGAQLSERELDPRDVIAEILEEHLMPDPRAVADAIVEHLRDAGFEITPIDYPKRRA